MLSIKKTTIVVLSALISTSIQAEVTVDLGADPQGNHWKIENSQVRFGNNSPTSNLKVEFPKPRHFRNHYQIKTALISVRLLCDQQDVAIDRIRLQDKSGSEIVNLAASDPSQMYAHLLPETIKDSVFAHACTVKLSAQPKQTTVD